MASAGLSGPGVVRSALLVRKDVFFTHRLSTTPHSHVLIISRTNMRVFRSLSLLSTHCRCRSRATPAHAAVGEEPPRLTGGRRRKAAPWDRHDARQPPSLHAVPRRRLPETWRAEPPPERRPRAQLPGRFVRFCSGAWHIPRISADRARRLSLRTDRRTRQLRRRLGGGENRHA